MAIDFGIVKPGRTLYVPFDSFAGSAGASITLTGLAVTDIEIYKDGSVTQRSSDAGYTLLDTDGIDFDGLTGIHGFSINLADNSDAGFYAAGSRYFVVVSSVTVDSQTVSFVACTFSIGQPDAVLNTTIATLASQTSFTLTAGPAEDDALNDCWLMLHDVASAVQMAIGIVSDYTGSTKTVTLSAAPTFTIAATDNVAVMGPMPMQPATAARKPVVDAAGLVDANVVKVGPTGSGTAQTAGDIIAAVAGIGTAGGAAINIDAATDNAAGGISGVTSGTTKVGTETGTFANTSFADASYHQITHSGNAIDWVYQFLTGGGTGVVNATWVGYLTSANDTITFYAWNHVGGAWEAIGTQVGQAGTSNVTKTLPLFARHRGTSTAELGKVYLRTACTGMTSPVLFTDQLFVSYAVTSRTVGYANGAVWIDTNTGVAGTESFVNGVADNPVSTLASALTIATNVGLRKFEIANGSTITLASTTSNKVFNGHEWNLALGGQDISSSMFIDAGITGTGTGSSAEFEDCQVGTASLGTCQMYRCTFTGTLSLSSAGDHVFVDCASQVAGTGTPVFDLSGAGAKTVSFRRWSGGMTINGITSDDVVSIDAVSGGTITLNGADGNVQVRGMVNIVDNRTGSPTLGTTNNMDTRFDTLDAAVAALPTAAGVADAVWDEAASGHTTAGTFGKSAADILADTNELQVDWVDGGRLDMILDSRASQSSVNTIDDFLDTEIGSIITSLLALDAALAVVDSNVDSILLDTGTDGVSLTSAAIDAIHDEPIIEPVARPAWASMTHRKIQQTLAVLMLNEIDSDSNSVDVRNDADSATLWAYPSSDDGTTYISGKAS